MTQQNHGLMPLIHNKLKLQLYPHLVIKEQVIYTTSLP